MITPVKMEDDEEDISIIDFGGEDFMEPTNLFAPVDEDSTIMSAVDVEETKEVKTDTFAPGDFDEPFDFRGSQISSRMGEHTSVFLRHRLTPPPEEVYTLHRKLAGAYMLCIQLGSVVKCRDLLEDVVRNHKFDDGPHPSM